MAKRQRGDVRVASRVIGKGTGHLLGRTLAGELGPAVRQWVWRGTMLTSASLVTVFLVWAGRWQRRLHQLMRIDEPPEWPILGVLILAAVVLALLVSRAAPCGTPRVLWPAIYTRGCRYRWLLCPALRWSQYLPLA